MLPLDEELAQYLYILWDVQEQSPLFWTAVLMTTTMNSVTTTASITTILIIVILELSAPHVSNVFGCLAPIQRFSLLNCYHSWTGVRCYGHCDNTEVFTIYTHCRAIRTVLFVTLIGWDTYVLVMCIDNHTICPIHSLVQSWVSIFIVIRLMCASTG